MELLLTLLAKLFALLLPVILENAQDTCEDGSDALTEPWQERVRSSGWSDEAIAATDPKERL